MSKSLYVYDKNTGKISYTVDSPSDSQISNLRSRGIFSYYGPAGYPIAGSYVEVDETTKVPIGIDKLRKISSINISNTFLIANGTDTVLVSNLLSGYTLTVPSDGFVFVANSTSNTVEFTVNGVSTIPDRNRIIFDISGYGYLSSRYVIQLLGANNELS